MQYLLTPAEYNELLTKKEGIRLENTKKLQDLCSKIANEMPIKGWLNQSEEKSPWGCILTKTGKGGYCDECPVQEICPNPHKSWSQ